MLIRLGEPCRTWNSWERGTFKAGRNAQKRVYEAERLRYIAENRNVFLSGWKRTWRARAHNHRLLAKAFEKAA